MSMYVANEKKMLGQFASNYGYRQLRDVVGAHHPALASLVEHGVSEHVLDVQADLKQLVGATHDADAASVAKALGDLIDGEEIIVITNGVLNGEHLEDEDDGETVYGLEQGPGFDDEAPGDEEKVLKGGAVLRKAASLPPLQRGGPTVDRARRQFQAKLGEFLRDAAAKIARRVLLLCESAEKVSKADAKPKLTPTQIAAMQAPQADEVLHIDWDDLIPEAEAALTTIAEAGGYQALAQLEIRDTDVISEVNSIAGKWAHERAAEMVGRKWVDGKLVENPNAQWAISESTRDSLRSVIEDAFSRNTGMRELSSAIQEAGAFSESRAMMIAKTEALLAENRGNLHGWQAGGVETISWTCSEDHDDNSDCSCLELEENSPYPVDAVPDLPHPSCWCTLSVDRLTGEPAEDDED
jgi:hypothetical protein